MKKTKQAKTQVIVIDFVNKVLVYSMTVNNTGSNNEENMIALQDSIDMVREVKTCREIPKVS